MAESKYPFLWTVWRRLNPFIAALGVALIIRGQWRWFENLDTIRPGGVPALVGMALVLLSISTAGIVLDGTPLFDLSVKRRFPLNWKLLFALLGVGMCLYAGWRANGEHVRVWDVLLIWGVGTWLAIYGLVPGDQMAAWFRRVARSLRQERRTWLLMGVLFLGSLAVRTIDLNHQPYIMAGDEAQFAWEAVSLKSALHWTYNPFQLGIWHHPRIVHTLMAISIQLFGQSVAAARLPWAVLGALTVPAVYLLGRRLYDARIGWIAALFMATFPVHIQFSRTAMDMTGDPLFLALSLAFAVGALRDGDMMEAALSGLCLGLSQYFYFAGRIAWLVVGAFFALYALRGWRAFWKHPGPLLVFAVLALIVFFPNFYATYMDKARPFSPRLNQVSIWATGQLKDAWEHDRVIPYLLGQAKHGFLAYTHYQDESDVYGRYNPVLGWYAGVPFMVGLMVVLRRWRDPRFSIAALWPAGTALLGGAMLIDPPHYPRYINPTPGLALLVALGTVQIALIAGGMWDTLRSWAARLGLSLKRLARPEVDYPEAGLPKVGRLKRWLPVGLALVLMLADGRSYFFDYLPATKARDLLYGETTIQLNQIADILKSFKGQYQVRRFSSMELDMNGTDLLRYLTPQNVGIELGDVPTDWATGLEPGPCAFVIAPQRFNEVNEELVRRFPGGQMREYVNTRTGRPLIYVYFSRVYSPL